MELIPWFWQNTLQIVINRMYRFAAFTKISTYLKFMGLKLSFSTVLRVIILIIFKDESELIAFSNLTMEFSL